MTKMNNILMLRVDEEFVNLIPPLQKEEYEKLRDNILSKNKVINPLIIWHGIIVDGHHRFKVISEHPEVIYRLEEIEFADRYEAISWICENQLGRRNLTPIQKTALLGKRYAAEKKTYGGARNFKSEPSENSSPHDEDLKKTKTASRIAKEMGVTHATVERAEKFVQGMDAAEEVLPGISREIISGQINPTREQVTAIAKAPIEERRKLAEQLRFRKTLSEEEKAERAKRREMMNMIAELSAYHGNINNSQAGIDSMLQSLSNTVNMMLGTCNTYFKEYPEMLTNREYRAQVLDILNRFTKFIKEIEEKEYE